MELPLNVEQRLEIKRQHRGIKDKRIADRLKIIVMLDDGFNDVQISRDFKGLFGDFKELRDLERNLKNR